MSEFNLINNIASCYIDVPVLLYYSHIPTAIIILLLGLYVFFKDRQKKRPSLFLLLISLVFAIWSVFDIILWTTYSSQVQMFFWSLFPLLFALMSAFCFLFLLSLIETDQKKIHRAYVILSALIFPIILLTPTDLNLVTYNTTFCEPTESYLVIYQYLFGIFVLLWSILLTIKKSFVANKVQRYKILLVSSAVLCFLILFTWSEIIGSITLSWEYTQYGLFGMPILAGLITYTTIRFNIFNIKLLATQALVASLVILVGSQLFFVETTTNIILVFITLSLTMIGGFYLVRSVLKEVKQREQIEELADKLKKANARLTQLDKLKSEFVSIASHQLRSPITAIRGYTSLLLDGDYGAFPKKAEEPLRRIEQSSRLMAMAIEDYLNVSRIESGNMKYNYTDLNLRDETEHICDDLRADAIKRGLVLIFRTDLQSRGVIHADLGKTVQIIQNLITNAIKYTKEGSIRVLVRDDVVRKRIYVDVIDTGIGMSEETLMTIFQKFERANNANSVNIHGTGLGLYVALKMAEAMGGTITAHSDGDGKGSCFTFEFPLAL